MKSFGKPRQPPDKYISWQCPRCGHFWAVDRVCVLGDAPWGGGPSPAPRIRYTRRGVRLVEHRTAGHCFCGKPFCGVDE